MDSGEEMIFGCQWYMGLKYHMEEALGEKGINKFFATSNPPFALFSRKYYNDIEQLDHKKVHDFCFIGSINSNAEERQWVIEFAKKYFTNNSIFINTDDNPAWEPLGTFDYSDRKLGFCPKQEPNNQSRKVQYRVVSENVFYFEKICQSNFVLCPIGDGPWSFRFYEVLMCKSIPIVKSWHHTYRTAEEAKLNYKYVLSDDVEKTTTINYDDFVKQNTQTFETHHLLK